MVFQCIQCHVLGYTSDLLHVQTPLAELVIPLKLKWKQGNSMPFGMSNHIQAVIIGGNVYVGGGFNFKNERIMLVYTVHTGLWGTLPPYESKWFGMAAVNNQLVLVGGVHPSTYKRTNILGVWNQTWTHPFPVLPTPRSQVSVISYHKWLIVAGGTDGVGQCVTKVNTWTPLHDNGMKLHHYLMSVQKCHQPSMEICGTCQEDFLLKDQTNTHSVCVWMS